MEKKYRYLFGPVPSRRFGRSLGVDLTPYKTCSQDCVFCQLGRTTLKTIERKEYVSTAAVTAELDHWLKTDGNADYITLSGSGEPTLHLRFGEVLNFIRASTDIPAVLLTNGALLHLPAVRGDAIHADVVKISLSAWDQTSYDRVNRPHVSLNFQQLIEGQMTFRAEFKGQLWMEVFLIKGVNSQRESVRRIADLADRITPDRIHLNTAVRPPAEADVFPVSDEELLQICDLFHPVAEIISEFGAKPATKTQETTASILSMLRRRPCTAEQISAIWGMHLNEVTKLLGKLLQLKQIRTERKNSEVYYCYQKRISKSGIGDFF